MEAINREQRSAGNGRRTWRGMAAQTLTGYKSERARSMDGQAPNLHRRYACILLTMSRVSPTMHLPWGGADCLIFSSYRGGAWVFGPVSFFVFARVCTVQ